MSIEWTHKKTSILDIRKVNRFYIISIDDKKINSPLFVDQGIFESRLNSYYLKEYSKNISSDIKREQVLNVKWNMVISKGFFYKIDRSNIIEEIKKDDDKYYISFLEIDGPLGNHIPG